MAPAGVVTVADLLSRNAAVTTKLPVVTETATTGVSVGSLLRREGRAPHTVDRPVQPRGHQQIDPPKADAPSVAAAAAVADPASTAKKTAVKRGAVAAGALLAVGSVVGAAVLSEVAPTGTEAQGATTNNSYPGQGRLNASQPEAPVLSASGVVDSAAAGDVLDAGTAPPTSWTPVAFPSAVAGVPAGIAGAEGGASDSSAPSTTQNSGSDDDGGRSGSDDGGSSGSDDGGSTGGGNARSGGDSSDSTPSTGADDAEPDGVVTGLVDDVDDTLSPVTGLLFSEDSDDSHENSAPQHSDAESSDRHQDGGSSDDNQDSDDNDGGRNDDGGNSRGGDSGKSSGGLLGGIGKVAAGLLGG